MLILSVVNLFFTLWSGPIIADIIVVFGITWVKKMWFLASISLSENFKGEFNVEVIMA